MTNTPLLYIKENHMKNSLIVLLTIWVALAILDIVALFVHIPLFLGIVFGVMNSIIIMFGIIPMVVDEFKIRKMTKQIIKEGK